MKPFYRQSYKEGTHAWGRENVFTLNNFSGGLNNVDPDNIIRDNECTDCFNLRFISNTLMETRFGFKFDRNAFGGTAVDGGCKFLDVYKSPNNPDRIITASNTALYSDGVEVVSGLAGVPSGVNFRGKYYFVDGKNLYMYDGTKYYKVVSDPVSWLTEASNTTQTTFKFRSIPDGVAVGSNNFFVFSSVSRQLENTIRNITAIDTVNNTITINSALNFTLPVDAPILFYVPLTEKVIGERVFDDTNKIAYYKPCMNEIADVYAGISYFPDSPNTIVVHSDRLFLSGDKHTPHGFFMSHTDEPLYFPSAAGITVKADGRPIVDMFVFDGALIVGRNEDMFVLYGDTERDSPTSQLKPFNIKQMDVTTGLISKNCGALLNNFYFFLGSDGRFYKLNTPTTFVEYLMVRPVDYKIDVTKAPINCPLPTVLSCVTYNNEVLWHIGNETIIVYSYDNMAWTYYKVKDSQNLFALANKLYAGTITSYVLKYDDEGESFSDVLDSVGTQSPVRVKYSSKRFDFGAPVNFKYYKNFLITCNAYAEKPSLFITSAEVDYFKNVSGELTESFLATFGVAKWNLVRFGAGELYKSPFYKLDVKGRSIKFVLHNEDPEITTENPMRIYDINLMYFFRDVR